MTKNDVFNFIKTLQTETLNGNPEITNVNITYPNNCALSTHDGKPTKVILEIAMT